MNRLIGLAFIAALIAFAPRARGSEDRGLSLGIRVAYDFPLGTAADGTRLNELTDGAVPVQLDLGYRIDRHWQAGAYAAWGPALVADEAKSTLAAQGATDISGHRAQRVGIQGIYRILPEAKLVPWVGLGLGYEWTRYAQAKLTSSTGTADEEVGLRGFEAILQVGGDYRVARGFSVGPVATVNVGQFRSYVKDVDTTSGTFAGEGSSSSRVADKGIHEWIQLGVKGTFDL